MAYTPLRLTPDVTINLDFVVWTKVVRRDGGEAEFEVVFHAPQQHDGVKWFSVRLADLTPEARATFGLPEA